MRSPPGMRAPDGADLHKPGELKEFLMRKQQAFLRSITEGLLADALGRGIRPGDTASIDAIIAANEKDGDRTRPWLAKIMRTYRFRCRRRENSGGF
jgi:hypothetical protein